ncbi:hypothetical protein DL771_009286 [Monosporascus sp. 5C6A]|nr:hypothetical protein DL771_009286 [Monosporascus sp. 5C6A]
MLEGMPHSRHALPRPWDPVAAAASTARVDLLLFTDSSRLDREDKEGSFVWINIDRDVLYLGDAASHWQSPFAYEHDGSVAFEKLPS